MSQSHIRSLQSRDIEQRLAFGLLPPGVIAHELGLKTVTVNAHIKKLRVQWKERTVRAKADWIPELLAIIDEVQRQAWIAWRRSLDFLAKSSHTTKELVSGTQEQTSVGRAEHLGDIRCLTTVLACVKLKSDLLGVGPADIARELVMPEVPGLEDLLAKLPPDKLDQITESSKLVEDLVRQLGIALPDDAPAS